MAFGPCMCGDPYCSSCGPAQGNYKCIHCGAWSEDGGCKDPAKCAAADKKMANDYAKEMEEMRKHEKEYERQRKKEYQEAIRKLKGR